MAKTEHMDVAARSEREAIVNYLREVAQEHVKLRGLKKYKISARHHFDACTWAAAAIERGDHHLLPNGRPIQ